jgi:hypothetical protein
MEAGQGFTECLCRLVIKGLVSQHGNGLLHQCRELLAHSRRAQRGDPCMYQRSIPSVRDHIPASGYALAKLGCDQHVHVVLQTPD